MCAAAGKALAYSPPPPLKASAHPHFHSGSPADHGWRTECSLVGYNIINNNDSVNDNNYQ